MAATSWSESSLTTNSDWQETVAEGTASVDLVGDVHLTQYLFINPTVSWTEGSVASTTFTESSVSLVTWTEMTE